VWDDADSGKLQYSVKEACARATLSNTNPTFTETRLNLGVHSARPVTDCLKRDMACMCPCKGTNVHVNVYVLLNSSQFNGTLQELPAMTYAATVKALALGVGARLTQLCTSANKMTSRFVKAYNKIN
jgi:hypothetical protein